MGKDLDKIKEMLKIQEIQGSTELPETVNNYMQGMYNGMEYVVAMMEDRDPNYLSMEEYMKAGESSDEVPNGDL